MMSLHQSAKPDEIVTHAVPVMDGEGNYTNVIRMTTRTGKQYDVTITPTN